MEKKAHRARLWRMLVKEYFSLEIVKAIKFLKDAENEKQEGIQGHWPRESPAPNVKVVRISKQAVVRSLACF